MTVADLQRILRNLSDALSTAGAKAVATDLEYICDQLGPFSDYKLKAFGDFLVKADTVAKGEIPPKKGTPAKPTEGSSVSLPESIDTVRRLYDSALAPTFDVAAVESEIKKLGSLKKADLEKIASEALQIGRKFTKKADLLNAMEQAIKDRKNAFDRAAV